MYGARYCEKIINYSAVTIHEHEHVIFHSKFKNMGNSCLTLHALTWQDVINVAENTQVFDHKSLKEETLHYREHTYICTYM